MSEPKAYKDLVVERYLKESIISSSHSTAPSFPFCALTTLSAHAQALYGVNYPSGHDWSVIVEKSQPSTRLARERITTYRAHVIVYTTPTNLRDWTPLESTTDPRATEKEALESLLEDLQQGLAELFKREYTYSSETTTVVGSDGKCSLEVK